MTTTDWAVLCYCILIALALFDRRIHRHPWWQKWEKMKRD